MTRCVDREVVSSISLLVYASDTGSPSRTGSTLVTIDIADVNDNKPIFTQPQFLLTYKEGFRGHIDLPTVRITNSH